MSCLVLLVASRGIRELKNGNLEINMRIIDKVRELGIGFVLETVFESIVPAWLFRIASIAVYQLDFEKMSGAPVSNASVSLCDDEQELAQLKEFTSDYSVQRQVIGVQAKVDDQIVGGLWLATHDYHDHDIGLSFPLGSERTWVYSARVDPAYRRQGIYSHLMSESAQSRNRQQKSAPLIAVSSVNQASRKAIQRFATLVGKVRVIRIGTVAWASSTGDLQQTQNWTFQCKRRPIEVQTSGQGTESVGSQEAQNN